MINKTQYKELNGDKVYDYLKEHIMAPNEIVGARIIDNKPYGYKEARFTIEILYKNSDTNFEFLKQYNYKKILRGIKSEERYEA